MNLNSKKKIKILTDFKSKLEMFNLNKKYLDQIKKNFSKNINVEFINLNKIKKKYDAEIYWGTRINNEIINKIKNLKWIHFGSVGVDRIDYDNPILKNILISNSMGINSSAMVNLIIHFLFDTSRKIIGHKKISNRKEYEKNYKACKDLSDQKICVLGYGAIAKKLEKFVKILNLDITFLSQRGIKKKNLVNLSQFKKNLKNYDTIINLLKFENKNQHFLKKELFNII